MALNGSVHESALSIILLPPLTLAAAVAATATDPVKLAPGVNYLIAEAIFVRAAGGTSATAYVQTSIDGLTWLDIMCFAFLTTTAKKVSAVTSRIAPAAQAAAPTDGSLADNTVIQGTLGKWLRLKYVTVGTYSGASSLAVYAVAKG